MDSENAVNFRGRPQSLTKLVTVELSSIILFAVRLRKCKFQN